MKDQTTNKSGVNWLAALLLGGLLSTSAWTLWVVAGGPVRQVMADELEAVPQAYPAGPLLSSAPPTYVPAAPQSAPPQPPSVAYPTTPFEPLPAVEPSPDAPRLPPAYQPVAANPYVPATNPYTQQAPSSVAPQPSVHAPLVANILFNGPETWQVQWSPQPLVGPYGLQGGQAFLPAHAKVMKGKNYLLTFHSDPDIEPRLWASLLISSETNRSRDFLSKRNLLIQWTADELQTADEKHPLSCVIYLPNADEDNPEPQQTKTLWSRDFPTELQLLVHAAQLGEVVAVVKLGLSEEEKDKLLVEEK